jgi:hypothetical protein
VAVSSIEAKGLLSGLFDFQFKSFITLKLIRVVYVLEVIGIFIAALFYFIVLVRSGSAGVAFAIILIPIGTLFYLIMARIMTEVIALFFRIGENTSIMAEIAAKTSGN